MDRLADTFLDDFQVFFLFVAFGFKGLDFFLEVSPHPIVHYNSTFPFTESRFGMGLVMKEQIEFVRLKFNLSPHNT